MRLSPTDRVQAGHNREIQVVRYPRRKLFKAKLAGRFPELEDELAGLKAGGDYEGPGGSPDRADAMVWAMNALMQPPRAEPRVRGL